MRKPQTGLIILLACLTLGLAPFRPEPHIWANLRWIMGGAKGMEMINWLDTLMHGFPWLLLIIWAGFQVGRLLNRPKGSPS